MIKTEIIVAIFTGLLSILFRPVISKILDTYIPDKEAMNRLIKILVGFLVKYVLNIGLIIYVFSTYEVVDKTFLIKVMLLFSFIIINLVSDILQPQIDKQLELFKKLINSFKN